MSNHIIPRDGTDESPSHESIHLAKAWQLSARAKEAARVRIAELRSDHPDAPWTQADEDAVREAAREFIVATERHGDYAMQAARAREAGAAYLRSCLREHYYDEVEQHGDHDRAFEAALRMLMAQYYRRSHDCYRRRVTHLSAEPIADIQRRWAVIELRNKDGCVAHRSVFCPSCAIRQQGIEERMGNRWPEPWEHEASTGEVSIRELRPPSVVDGLRCSRCDGLHGSSGGI